MDRSLQKEKIKKQEKMKNIKNKAQEVIADFRKQDVAMRESFEETWFAASFPS